MEVVIFDNHCNHVWITVLVELYAQVLAMLVWNGAKTLNLSPIEIELHFNPYRGLYHLQLSIFIYICNKKSLSF